MQKIEVSKRRLAAIDSYDHEVDFQVGGKWFRKNYWHDSAEREVFTIPKIRKAATGKAVIVLKNYTLTHEAIKKIALENGFKLKEQPNGEMGLHPYVYEFALAIADHVMKGDR